MLFRSHISEAMCRWIAPILSFTAEELWQAIPGKRGESVLLENWYQDLTEMEAGNSMNMDFWQTIFEIRSCVSKELEPLRADKTIGSPLDAEVTLFVDEKLRSTLESLKDELRFVLITSKATVKDINEADESCIETTTEGDKTIKIKTSASEDTKCVRCWHHQKDVGSNTEHPELCGRCIENVAGDGEQRLFA